MAALQSPLLKRLADTASSVEGTGALVGVDVESTVGRAVATFVRAIAPAVGPDNVSDLPLPSDFKYEPRGGAVFSSFSMDDNSYTSTELLLTFDDFGLLLAGARCEYYSHDALDMLIGLLSEHIPALASYFATVVNLLSRPSIKRLFGESVEELSIPVDRLVSGDLRSS
ncbi:hypothetical protein [Mycobacterium sp. SMC-17]|uniref:hypothetical protein n=1 Tax=Mycobacterium sp. SMC-17 TaxID=3381628 RepID=UPI003876D085